MVDHIDPRAVAGIDHARRQHEVVRAGRRIARRIVVKEHGRRGGRRGASRNTSRGRTIVEARDSIDAMLAIDHLVFGVEYDHAELLYGAGVVLWREMGSELTRCGDPWAVCHDVHERPTTELNGGDDLSAAGRFHSRHVSQTIQADPYQAVEAADLYDEVVREIQGASVAGAAAEYERGEFVVPKAEHAEEFQLLAWAILWCRIFHRRYTRALMILRFSARSCFLAALLAFGCAEPPNREIGQAQGAIDAAQAAGADRYATTEYFAATEALRSANAAVAARDHRLALSYALESREQAQNAARGAVDAKARVRVEVDHASTEIAALVDQARSELAAAERSGVPRPELEQPAADLTAATVRLQKADKAVAAGDYLGASAVLERVREQVGKALAMIDDAMP